MTFTDALARLLRDRPAMLTIVAGAVLMLVNPFDGGARFAWDVAVVSTTVAVVSARIRREAE